MRGRRSVYSAPPREKKRTPPEKTNSHTTTVVKAQDVDGTATVVPFPGTVVLECPQCGATGQGSCHCGIPYIPAGDAAAKAIAENPGLSDRAIAEKTGIGHASISRHRSSTVVLGRTDPMPREGAPAAARLLKRADQVRMKPCTSLSAQSSVFSIGSPCMWRTVILVMVPWVKICAAILGGAGEPTIDGIAWLCVLG